MRLFWAFMEVIASFMAVISRDLVERDVFKSSMRSFHSSASSSRCKTWWRTLSLTEELALAGESRSSISMSSMGLVHEAGLMMDVAGLLTEGGDAVNVAGSLTLIERIGLAEAAGVLGVTGALRGVKVGDGVVVDTFEGVEKNRRLLSDGSPVSGDCPGV